MSAGLSTTDLRERVAAMAPAIDDADRIEQLRHLESLKAAISAMQARLAVDFDRSQRATAAVAGVPQERQGRGVAEQVALALRISPWKAQRWLGWAKILVAELPCTLARLEAGETTEWRTVLVARETAVLDAADRARVDRELAPRLAEWGDRRVDAETRRAVYRLDPHAALARTRRAEQDRRVTLRPAPDTMCRLTALLPVAEGVAAYAALHHAAATGVGVGDEPRTRGRLMADTLVQRLTGRASADDVSVELNLIMTDRAFLGGSGDGAEPGWLDGYGPVPAPWARELVTGRAGGPGAPRWIRRLYTDRARLVAVESTRRRFTPGQQRHLRLRDRTCRTPWCDAPIRHADHVVPHQHGGPTDIANGQGLCVACNHARQAPGWAARVRDGTVLTRTPTGHRYRSRPPTLHESSESPLERRFAELLGVA